VPGAVTVHLLGARGPVGAVLAEALAAEPGVALRGFSGEPGPRSYAAFLADWRGAADDVVVVAGGSTRSALAELVDAHVTRLARALDRFEAAGWPGRLLLLGSAAELVPESTYGAVKAAQHRLAAAAAGARGVPFVCLRLHSLVPESRPARGLFAELLAQYEAGGAVSVHHLGGARDYVTGAQLGLACATIAAHPEAWADPAPRVVDVGNGAPVTVTDWLAAFRSEFAPEPALEEQRPGHPDRSIVADPAPLRGLLARCDPGAVARYDARRPDLGRLIRGWRAGAP